MFMIEVTKVDLARHIGVRYLEDYPEGMLNLHHSNHDVAKKLTKLKEDLSDQQLEKLLLAYYFKLPNAFGSMAKSLRHFFTTHLQKPYLLVTNYSLGKINQIGQDYLDKFPEGGFRLFSHTQQDSAQKLKNYQPPHKMDRVSREEVIRKQWLELYDLYRGLSAGELSQELGDVFLEVFNVKLYDSATPKIYIMRQVDKAIAALPKADDIQSFTSVQSY